MGGEASVSVVGRRLMVMLEDSLSSQHASQTVRQSSFQPSTVSLETAAIEVLMVLDQSSRRNSLSTMRALMQAANAGQTLLHLSAALGFEHLLKELLIRGMDVDQRDANGFTALHFAALYGHTNCARLIVGEGADFEIVDIWGRAAKHVALESRHHDVAEFLEARESVSVNVDEIADEECYDENYKPLEEPKAVPRHVDCIIPSPPIT